MWHTHTQTYTHFPDSHLCLVPVSREHCPGQMLLFILMPPESDAAWHQHVAISQAHCPTPVFVFEPADCKECNDKSWYIVTLHTHAHTLRVSSAVNTSRQESVGMSVSTGVMEIMMSSWKEFPHLMTAFLLVADVDWSVITRTGSSELWQPSLSCRKQVWQRTGSL